MELAAINFNTWLKRVSDKNTLEELLKIRNDAEEIESRFEKDIEFGTAGLRGIMEPGSNRINIYTICRATQGLANYLNANCKEPSVAISYDSRRNSKLYAEESAAVLAANGIKAYITRELAPTPFLSYCVRKLGAKAGIMITASHNTAEYNGYKCYGADGAQMNEEFASAVYEYIKKVDMFSDIKKISFADGVKNGKIEYTAENVAKEYIEEIIRYRNDEVLLEDLRVTYTALNGTGSRYVKHTLNTAGVRNISVVSCQDYPDENFSTCPSPNPELKAAFDEAIKVATENNSDIILATDPDADRLGVCVKGDNGYRLLSGNELGILLTNYILERKKMTNSLPESGKIIKTIVSTPMIDEIAKKYGCKVVNVLTGFKNIAHEIAELEKLGLEKNYIFGFEESNGYLCGTYARDKDAVSACVIVCEAAAYYRDTFNKTLLQVLEDLYDEYGYFGEKTVSYNLGDLREGIDVANIMKFFRDEKFRCLGGHKIVQKADYLKCSGTMKSNVIEFITDGGTKIIVRPSGTEPKIKFYIMTKAGNSDEKEAMIRYFCEEIEKLLRNTI